MAYDSQFLNALTTEELTIVPCVHYIISSFKKEYLVNNLFTSII